jgi:hypothetical protein
MFTKEAFLDECRHVAAGFDIMRSRCGRSSSVCDAPKRPRPVGPPLSPSKQTGALDR